MHETICRIPNAWLYSFSNASVNFRAIMLLTRNLSKKIGGGGEISVLCSTQCTLVYLLGFGPLPT